MSKRAQDISKRIEVFRDEVITFVENLSPGDWNAVTGWESWTAGVVARHLGAGHFAFFNFLGMMIEGKALPQLTMEQIHEMSKQDAKQHADCTKDEALDELRKNGAKMVSFVSGLSDEELDRTGSIPALGGEVSVAQVIEMIVFQSSQQHFDSMREAVGRQP